jgi:hypothetical protein
MNARDRNRDKVLKKGSVTDRPKIRTSDRTCFWRTVAAKLAFRDKRESPGHNAVNQLSGKDRGSISNLSHSRWAPSNAYIRDECVFQFGSIGAHRLSIVQYLPKEAGLTPPIARDIRKSLPQ